MNPAKCGMATALHHFPRERDSVSPREIGRDRKRFHFTRGEVVRSNSSNSMKRLKTGMNGKNGPELVQLVLNCAAGAAGKVEFDDCPISLADLTTLANAGTTALTDESMAKDVLGMKRTARAVKFKQIREGFEQFAAFARSVYKDDKLALQAVCLDVVEIGGPIGLPDAPANLRSVPGALEATIGLRWNKTRRDFYEVECASSVSGPWTRIYAGKAQRTTCIDLVPGAEYFFRVRARTAAGYGPWSDITKCRAS